MQLNIITPEKILFSAAIQMVVIPGTEGDFGVMPGHMPFISTIRPGVITVTEENGAERQLAILAGIAEVVPKSCTILAELALEAEGITADHVKSRFEIAQNKLEQSEDEKAQIEAEKHMAFAEALKFLLGEPLFE